MTRKKMAMAMFWNTMILPGALLACISSPVAAQAMQDLQPIRDAALVALQAGPSVQAMVAPGLRLTACSQPLTAQASTPVVAEVRCPDSPGWRLFVPVRTTIQAAARVAPPQEQEANAILVKRGDPVVLRASFGNSEVRMGGRALGQAMVGNVLNVENDSSHRIIRGRLSADGTVEVLN